MFRCRQAGFEQIETQSSSGVQFFPKTLERCRPLIAVHLIAVAPACFAGRVTWDAGSNFFRGQGSPVACWDDSCVDMRSEGFQSLFREPREGHNKQQEQFSVLNALQCVFLSLC